MKQAKFCIKKSNDNQWYFTLVAPNGEIIGTSEMYTRKQSAKKGISSVKNNAHMDNFVVKESSDNKHYFVLKARNGKIILVSEMYNKTNSVFRGMTAIVEYATEASTSD